MLRTTNSARRTRAAPVTGIGLRLAVSAVLLSIALGVGVPHVREHRWSVLAVVGVGCLLGGGLLLTTALLALVWMHRRWSLLTVPLVVVAVAVAVDVFAIPLAVTSGPHRGSSAGGRDPVPGFSTVQVPGRDGVPRTGWYAPSRTGAAVLMLHGSGSTSRSVVPQAQILARHGFGVLLLDALGHGESAGRPMEWGWRGDVDVGSALDVLQTSPGVDGRRMAVLGLSIGGEEAIGAAATDARIRAVVAEGATGRQAADLHWLSDVYGWRGQLQEGIEVAHTKLVGAITRMPPPVTLRAAAARAAPRPMLLVAAGDRVDEEHAAADIRSAAAGSVQVWVVPESGHTAGLATAPREWEHRVVTFLTESTR